MKKIIIGLSSYLNGADEGSLLSIVITAFRAFYQFVLKIGNQAKSRLDDAADKK